ncbi:MAG: NupC/NupG family nucleoside CNT transporter [Janthinobacterium lividum]
MQGLLGYAALFALAFALSEARSRIPWRTVIGGFALQWALALLLLHVPLAQHAVLLLNDGADALQRATDQGTAFLFGYLGGGALPFVEARPNASFILAFKMLPLVLVISALGALLFHWGVLQRVVGVFAWLLRRAIGVGGALALAAAVHIFVGMIEAPILVRPYLSRMSRGELFAMMTCGMAGVAGTVMVIYGAVLAPVLPNALGSIIIASVISTPAALAVAALMVPFTAPPDSGAALVATPASSSLDALVRGTADGVGPLVGITTSLLVTIALVALVNAALGALPLPAGPWTLQSLLAVPLRPVVWLIGVPWAETGAAGLLLATKTILNEFVAYLNLAALPPEALSPRSRVIMTFALCGFANFGSLGILVGGLAAMLPERRPEIAALGLRSLASGTLATCLSGAVAGVLS